MRDDDRKRGRRPVVIMFLLAVALIAAVGLPLWRPLLLAAVVAGPLGGWHDGLARKLGGRRTVSAAVFTVSVGVLVLFPLGVALYFVIEQAIQLAGVVESTLHNKGLSGLLQPLPDAIEHWINRRYQDLSQLQIWSGTRRALGAAVVVLTKLSHLAFDGLIFGIALFFLFRDGHALVRWLRSHAPLPPEQIDELLDKFRSTAKSIIGGHVLTGTAQAVLATVGYLISRLPSPALFGLLTLVASFIPSVGTALVAIPAVALLALLGHPWWAVFLGGWMLVVVGLVDNVLRPVIMRGGSTLRGSLIFFSLMGGALMFGPIGLVVGPLALVFFLVTAETVQPAHE